MKITNKTEIELMIAQALQESEDFENADFRTFGCTLVTSDNGLVIDMEDGTRIHLTIQAYTETGRSL